MFLDALNTEQKEALICLAHNVVVSDGDLTAGEEAMMSDMRVEMDLPDEVEAAYRDLSGIEEVFDTTRSRAIALISLIRIAYADGAFEIEEQCFLRDLAERFEVPGERFDLMGNWVRRSIALEREIQQFF